MTKPLIIKNLSKTFNKGKKFPTDALVDVSFALNQSEVTGLIGPNGAGKTTLMRIVLGFENYDSGTVQVFDDSPQSVNSKKYLGFQSDSQFRSKNIKVKEYLQIQSRLAGFCKNDEQIDEYLELFQLTNAAGKNLNSLSRGMRQKVELIQSFLGNPQMVILDEPTAGLDPPSVFELRDFINNQKKNGITVLFSSHHLSEVEKVCDRVLFIQEGKLQGDYILKDLEAGFLEDAFRKYEQERRFV